MNNRQNNDNQHGQQDRQVNLQSKQQQAQAKQQQTGDKRSLNKGQQDQSDSKIRSQQDRS